MGNKKDSVELRTASPSSSRMDLELRSMPELVVAVTAIYCAAHLANAPLPFFGR